MLLFSGITVFTTVGSYSRCCHDLSANKRPRTGLGLDLGVHGFKFLDAFEKTSLVGLVWSAMPQAVGELMDSAAALAWALVRE